MNGYGLVNFAVLNLILKSKINFKIDYLDIENKVIDLYICTIICSFAFILNMFCVFIFSNERFKDFVFYKYLMIESILISTNMFIQSLRPINFNRQSFFSKTLFSQIYLNIFLYYISSALEMSAFFCHILSLLDFYLLISNSNKKPKLYTKISYIQICLFVIVFSFVSYAYNIFIHTIISYSLVQIDPTNNKVLYSVQIYTWKDTPFYHSTLKKIIEISVNLLRDGLNLLFLIVLNILIYLRVHDSLNRKRKLQIIKSNQVCSTDVTLSNIKVSNNLNKTHEKLLIMILFGTLNYTFGRLPILVKFILSNIFQNNYEILNSFATLCVYIAYVNTFFLYYYTNSRFSEVFKKYCAKLKF